MQIVALTYETYQAAHWSERTLLRSFRKWDAWATFHEARPALVLDEYVRRCVTLCVYDNLAERDADIVVLQTIPDAPPPPSGSPDNGGAPATAALFSLPLPPRKPQTK